MSDAEAPFIHERAVVETDRIGAGTRVWAFAHVLAGAVIGRNCNLCDGVFVESGAVIGDNVVIKNNISVWDGVRLGDNVFLGPSVVLTNDPYPRANNPDFVPTPTVFEEGVTVGANATILCGITLGRRCTVAAGSVVTADVPPYALVLGNPARQRGWVCHCGVPLPRQPGGELQCGKCSRRYSIEGDRLESRS